MAITFSQMVEEAENQTTGLEPEEIQQRLVQDPQSLVVDVRDATDIPSTGMVSGGVNISLGMLPVKADTQLPPQWRDDKLQNRDQQIFVTCQIGGNAARGAKVLKDMGFTNVYYMKGGMQAWTEAHLPTT